MRQKAQERENQLLRKFCLLLNEKKMKIKDLQLNGNEARSDGSSSEDEEEEESEGEKSLESDQVSQHARRALDPSQVLKRLQKLADSQQTLQAEQINEQQLGSQLQFGNSLDHLSDQDLINS